jgi:diguanylate cyclase (GGDEF)-like protein
MSIAFYERLTTILSLHWSVVTLTLAVLYFGDQTPGFSLNDGLILVLLAGHLALSKVPRPQLRRASIIYLLVLSCIAGACLAVVLAAPASATFCVLLFLVAIAAASIARTGSLIAAVLGVSLVYPLSLISTGARMAEADWLTCLLLPASGLYFGYLAQLERLDKEKAEAGSKYATDLFEFGRTLSQAEGPDPLEALHNRIPRQIAQIMSVSNCELALVENDRIVKRILPNRHTRDFVGLPLADSIHERSMTSSDVAIILDLQDDAWSRTRKDFSLYGKDFSLYPYRTYMATALNIAGRKVGVVALYTEKPATWNEYSKRQFQFLVDQSALTLQNTILRLELERQASKDGLTGLANHRYFHECLEEEFGRARRKRHCISVALLDLDFFKKLNDSAGHRVGDLVLEALGVMLKENVRGMDRAGRIGGDEFAVAMPETDAENAHILCQRILNHAARLKVEEWSGFSLSIGCATYPQDGGTLSEILEHADQALYRSKHLGRGRVSRYSDAPDRPAPLTPSGQV